MAGTLAAFASCGRCTPFSHHGFPARSRGRGEPLAVALLGEQPLRKIYPLREFRHLVPQLLHLLEHRVACRSAARGPGAAPQPLGERLAHGGEGDHPGKEAADGDDGNQQRDDAFHDRPPAQRGGASRSASRCLASSRSVKSIRSDSSESSRRTCCNSATTSSSWAASPCSRGEPPRIRSPTALPMGENASAMAIPPPKTSTIRRMSSIPGSTYAARAVPTIPDRKSVV